MSLIRRLMLSLLTALVFTMPLGSLTSQARATQPHQQSQARYYYVYYRECPESPWYFYGAYQNYYYAEYVAYYLQYYGYETYIR